MPACPPRGCRALPGAVVLLLAASSAFAAAPWRNCRRPACRPAWRRPACAAPCVAAPIVHAAQSPDALTATGGHAAAPSGDRAADFVSLFNGRDLEGWQGKVDGYEVVDGVMHCRPGHGGNVFTVAEYDDFVLRFDFKLAPGANNGLGIRMPPAGDAAYVAMELQILDDAHPKYADLKPWQVHGSIYGVVPAERGCLKPAGEWNTEEVTVRGSRVKVVVNGTTIVDADVADFRDGKSPTADGKPHPGLARTTGHIGFLGHGDEVWFRNLAIKSLTAASSTGT